MVCFSNEARHTSMRHVTYEYVMEQMNVSLVCLNTSWHHHGANECNFGLSLVCRQQAAVAGFLINLAYFALIKVHTL